MTTDTELKEELTAPAPTSENFEDYKEPELIDASIMEELVDTYGFESLYRSVMALLVEEQLVASGQLAHEKRELELAGYYYEDYPIAPDILELLAVFSKQGHSGFSASEVANVFKRLVNGLPLSPIMGTDDEWTEYAPGNFQNNRCSAIFKDSDGAHYINAIIWRELNGATFSSGGVEGISSSQPITFPFIPKTFIVDTIGVEYSKDNWTEYIKDMTQLIPVNEYYKTEKSRVIYQTNVQSKISKDTYLLVAEYNKTTIAQVIDDYDIELNADNQFRCWDVLNNKQIVVSNNINRYIYSLSYGIVKVLSDEAKQNFKDRFADYIFEYDPTIEDCEDCEKCAEKSEDNTIDIRCIDCESNCSTECPIKE